MDLNEIVKEIYYKKFKTSQTNKQKQNASRNNKNPGESMGGPEDWQILSF